MTTIDTARLRALAEAATHQRWHATSQGGIEADDYDGPGEVFDSVATVHDPADWEYIAAADPRTMLALLDEIERLRDIIERVDDIIVRHYLDMSVADDILPVLGELNE